MMAYVVVGCTVIVGAGWYAFSYFSNPARVAGSKLLDCPPTEIQIIEQPEFKTVQGCKKSIRLVCQEEGCRPLED